MIKKISGQAIQDTTQLDLFNTINIEKNIKTRTTFRLSKEAKRQMNIRIVQDEYGMRGKSQWVTEALMEFIDPKTWLLNVQEKEPINSWKRIVIDTELLREKLVVDAVNIDEATRIQLWKSAIDVAIYGSKLDDPEYLDISSAAIVRAAIMWKLSK